MSEPNTSEPLHSSCTRQASVRSGSREPADVAEHVDGLAADRRQEDLEIGRVTSSGNMPPVCSNRWRRRLVSPMPQRSATPGRYQTGSSATLVQLTSPCSRDDAPSGCSRSKPHRMLELRHGEARMRDRDRRPDVPAVRELAGERLAHDVAVGIERDDLLRIGPLRIGPDRHRRRGVGQVGPMQRIEAARSDRERAVERVGAGMGADHVAPAEIAEGADHRPARCRAGGAPGDLGRLRTARARVRGQRDVAGRFRPARGGDSQSSNLCPPLASVGARIGSAARLGKHPRANAIGRLGAIH